MDKQLHISPDCSVAGKPLLYWVLDRCPEWPFSGAGKRRIPRVSSSKCQADKDLSSRKDLGNLKKKASALTS